MAAPTAVPAPHSGAGGSRRGVSGTDTPAGMGGTQATGAGGNMHGLASVGAAERSGRDRQPAASSARVAAQPGAPQRPKPSGTSANLRVVGPWNPGAQAVAAAQPSTVGGGMVWSWELPVHFPEGQVIRVTVDGGELRQDGEPLGWNPLGYYEVSLDAKSLAWSR